MSKDNSERAPTELEAACEAAKIEISSIHVLVETDKDSKVVMDHWKCTLKFEGRSETFDYRTGIGLRTKPKPMVYNRNPVPKPTPPTAADVLYCLLADFSACETTFEEWASGFGLNSDSIKALETYLTCQKDSVRVRKLLGYQLMNELRNKEH